VIKKQRTKYEIEMDKQKAYEIQRYKMIEEEKVTYPQRLLDVLYECLNVGCGIIEICTHVDESTNVEYFMFDVMLKEYHSLYLETTYLLPKQHDGEYYDMTFNDLFLLCKQLKEQKEKEQRIAQIKAEALAKLTKEELKVLGL
jgi:hypothetical protein